MKSKRDGKEFFGSVSPKGQITLPVEIRRELGIHPKDEVAICIEDGAAKIRLVGSRVLAHYQSVPALDPSRTWKELEEIVRDDMAENAAREGMP